MRGELIGGLPPFSFSLQNERTESWIDRKDGTIGKLE
jgi:hypothetical protein